MKQDRFALENTVWGFTLIPHLGSLHGVEVRVWSGVLQWPEGDLNPQLLQCLCQPYAGYKWAGSTGYSRMSWGP